MHIFPPLFVNARIFNKIFKEIESTKLRPKMCLFFSQISNCIEKNSNFGHHLTRYNPCRLSLFYKGIPMMRGII